LNPCVIQRQISLFVRQIKSFSAFTGEFKCDNLKMSKLTDETNPDVEAGSFAKE